MSKAKTIVSSVSGILGSAFRGTLLSVFAFFLLNSCGGGDSSPQATPAPAAPAPISAIEDVSTGGNGTSPDDLVLGFVPADALEQLLRQQNKAAPLVVGIGILDSQDVKLDRDMPWFSQWVPQDCDHKNDDGTPNTYRLCGQTSVLMVVSYSGVIEKNPLPSSGRWNIEGSNFLRNWVRGYRNYDIKENNGCGPLLGLGSPDIQGMANAVGLHAFAIRNRPVIPVLADRTSR